ncbi:MAG: glutamine synthetase [Propionibacteriaceae bacterium]|nr:glutamine synthetase [Propionibacteriaceae bacterium]
MRFDGRPVFNYFVKNKRAEFEEYRRQVTPWKLRQFLSVL